MSQDRKRPINKAPIFIGVIVVIALAVLVGVTSIQTIPAGHRGVILNYGAVDTNTVLGEGINRITPFAQSVVLLEVAHQLVKADVSASSHDLQDVKSSVSVEYNINPSTAAILYQTYLGDHESRLISPAIQETVKSITAQFTATELITKRPEVKTAIDNALAERLGKSGIQVVQTSITDFQFSTDFTNAIEQKQVAEQQAEQAQNILKQKQIEAQYKVAEAQGQAQSIKIVNDALTSNPNYLEWFKANKWDGHLPQVVGGNGAIPMVAITQPTK